MNGYDIDGVITAGVEPVEPCVIVSGRTFAEYDDTCRQLAQRFPVYVRGVGDWGDPRASADFKAEMVRRLGVTTFFEDSPLQARLIKQGNPDCHVVVVQPLGGKGGLLG